MNAASVRLFFAWPEAAAFEAWEGRAAALLQLAHRHVGLSQSLFTRRAGASASVFDPTPLRRLVPKKKSAPSRRFFPTSAARAPSPFFPSPSFFAALLASTPARRISFSARRFAALSAASDTSPSAVPPSASASTQWEREAEEALQKAETRFAEGEAVDLGFVWKFARRPPSERTPGSSAVCAAVLALNLKGVEQRLRQAAEGFSSLQEGPASSQVERVVEAQKRFLPGALIEVSFLFAAFASRSKNFQAAPGAIAKSFLRRTWLRAAFSRPSSRTRW